MKFIILLALATLCFQSCGKPSESTSAVKVTHVDHSSVKQQSIGNCWLYAQATWLESLLLSSSGKEINVSESYWEYWDLFDKLMNYRERGEHELNTGGSWGRGRRLLEKYGWIEEENFISDEKDSMKAKSQACAETYLLRETMTGGRLDPAEKRTEEQVKEELNRAFSCEGTIPINMEASFQKRHRTSETLLQGPNSATVKSLTNWLQEWNEFDNDRSGTWSAYEGKKLPSEAAISSYRALEQRMKAALNDHQPVILSFYVSFNATNGDGLFNLNSLATKGQLGHGGGHMLVLHDYAVNFVPGIGRLGEGELDAPAKNLAMLGELDHVVAKNSWGKDREDRPWLKDGYSRISWDYLTKTYFDEESGTFRPFLQGIVFPPGY